ncbi:hypothetical protein AB1Y20_012250 [Prymnesium parvum]|uniref:RRM domain-containing protein n=1 Tax=Prymnesium parvum TaxID=97485 RepID=A0AB34INZ1_PRYPA
MADEEVAQDELEGVDVDGEAAAAEVDEELEAMKNKVKAMEEEAEKLQKIQDQVAEELEDSGEGGGEEANAEADARSIYVGSVDYSATPEELQEHFAACGTINRVTILCDKFKQPKGFAYIEFSEPEGVLQAVELNESEFKGRQLKVVAKRTNRPGLGKGKGKGKAKGKGYPGKGAKGRGFAYGGYKGGGYQPFYRPRYRGRGYRPY